MASRHCRQRPIWNRCMPSTKELVAGQHRSREGCWGFTLHVPPLALLAAAPQSSTLRLPPTLPSPIAPSPASGISCPAREAHSLGCGPHLIFYLCSISEFSSCGHAGERICVDEKNVEWDFFTLEIHTGEFKWNHGSNGYPMKCKSVRTLQSGTKRSKHI